MIRTENLADGGAASSEARVRRLLEGEITGLDVFCSHIERGGGKNFGPCPGRQRVLLLLEGVGSVVCGGSAYGFGETAVFAPHATESFIVLASAGLTLLEILYDAGEENPGETDVRHNRPPYFQLYSKCKTYREAIKSEKTVNRTLLPVGAVPRFCMGSVETFGPDEVAPHSHPMLEQLFLGLAGNRCTVTADGEEAALEEGVLLHIPRGSEHGASVQEGCLLRYVWMDYFLSDDMSYIGKSHIEMHNNG